MINTINMGKQKVIALVDCDSFFVSCEQKRNPELLGKPVCVLSNNDGCVISRAKEAKNLGIKMGEPYFMAKKDHPQGIYITADHAYYSFVSNEVMTVLKDFSPFVQIYSVDEAFIDLTGLRKLYKKNYYDLGILLKEKIMNETSIPVSIGISSTKTLAKLASDKSKNTKSHVFMIGKRKSIKVLEKTQIEELWGIGRRLTKKLKENGILTANEFINKSDLWIDKNLGINGLQMKQELLGVMTSCVSNKIESPKSIQNTRAFGIFTSDFNYIKNELNRHIHTSCSNLRKWNTKCLQVGVMLRTKDFRVYFTKKDLLIPTDFELEISNVAIELLKEIYRPDILYRATGVVLSRIGEQGIEQLSLYENDELVNKKSNLTKCIDRLETKFGKNIIKTGFSSKKN